jgi:protein-tyrosine phosphatase
MVLGRARVCFVCLGNICRSPTAEGVMKSLVADQDLADRIVVDSAGTAAYHVGERADRRSREAAARRGIALESRARQFTLDDFAQHDYVLAMDRENLAHLAALRARTEFAGHLSLLRDFDGLAAGGSEVPDPYYGGDAGFEEVLDLCEAACRGLIERIRRDWEP